MPPMLQGTGALEAFSRRWSLFVFYFLKVLTSVKCTNPPPQYYTGVFLALKIPCAPSIHSSHPSSKPLADTELFYCRHGFAFSRMSHSWKHTVCNLCPMFQLGCLYLSYGYTRFLMYSGRKSFGEHRYCKYLYMLPFAV